MTDIISTGIAIDSSDAVKAKKDLDNLATTGEKVDTALDKVQKAGDRTGKTLATLSANTRKVADSSAEMVKHMEGLNSAQARQEALLKQIGSSFAGLTQAILGSAAATRQQQQATQAAAKATQEQSKAAQDAAKAKKAEAQAAKEAAQAARQAQQQAEREAATRASAAAAAERYIQKLRDEVRLHGASRAQIEAHRAAQMGLTAEQQKTARALGGQLDALERNKRSMSGFQTIAANVGTAVAVAFAAKKVYDFADSLFKASAEAQRLRTTLQFATGNAEKDFSYVTRVADDLGLQFSSTADAYAKFAAAAKGTTLEGEGARRVFESISKAAAVMGLSSEQASGALLALQQMISKGTVQAEELRGQLGERLPGSFQIAARAMGVTTAELGKLLEQGQVVASDFLPKFAAELERSLGDAPERAANRLDASMNRLDNAWGKFKRTVGDSGVSEYMASRYNLVTDALDGITESMQSAERAGGGFISQAVAGTGAVLAFLNPLNAISPSAQSAGGKLKEAETRLKELQERARHGVDVSVEMGQLVLLIAKLRQAKAEIDGFSAGAGRGSVNPPTIAQMAAQRAQLDGELSAYFSENARQTKAQVRTEEIGKAIAANAKLVKSVNERLTGEERINALLKLRTTLETEVSNINEKYKDKKGPKTPDTTRRDDKAQLAFDLEDIRSDQERALNTITNKEQLLDAQRSASLVREEDYWEQKKKLQADGDRVREEALTKEIERMRKETFSGANATADKLANDRKIKASETELAKQRENAAARQEVLSIQQKSALEQIVIQYKQAEAAAQSYVDTISRQNQRDLDSMGLGSFQRQINSRINQREDQHLGRVEQLQGQFRANQITKEQLEKYLEIEESAYQRSLQLDREYWDKKREQQKDGLLGAQEALQNYIDEIDNAYERSSKLFSEGLDSLTDGLTGLLTGDKGQTLRDFGKKFVDQITKGIVEQQFTKPIAQWLQSQLSDPESGLGNFFGGLLGGNKDGSTLLGDLLGVGGSKTGASARGSSMGNPIYVKSVDSLLGSASTGSAGGGGGGLLGSLIGGAASLFGGFSNSTAGTLANALPGDSLDNLFKLTGGWKGWDEGGYTGNGGKHEIAGAVHRGEYVVNAEATRALGLSFLERLNRAGHGYASGGFARSVATGNLQAPSSSAYHYSPTINVDGDIDKRTANQLSNRLSREQRIAQARMR